MRAQALLSAVLAWPLGAGAATHTVCPAGCAHTSLDSALLVAADGDRIEIAAGTYAQADLEILRDLEIVGVDGPEVTVIDSTAGGELFDVEATVTFEGLTFRGNSARVFTVQKFANVTLRDVIVELATTSSDGAGLYLRDSATVTIQASTFRDNGTLGCCSDGGHVATESSGTLLIDDSTFERGLAGSGGAIAIRAPGSAVITNSSFVANQGDTRGGAIWTRNGVEVHDSTFDDNFGGKEGGAIYSEEGSVTVTGTGFYGGVADYGGAVYMRRGTPVVTDSQFEHNAAIDGGALYLAELSAGGTVLRNLFCANDASGRGGAVLRDASGLSFAPADWTWSNNVVWENEALTGGGFYLDADTYTHDLVLNNTFAANTATGFGSAVYQLDGDPLFENNAVTGHTVGTAVYFAGAASPWLDYNLWFGNVDDSNGVHGASSIFGVDPMYTGHVADGDCTNDSFWPLFGSPLIDAGSPARFDPDGSTSDIGAYGGPDAPEGYDADGDGASGPDDCDDADPTRYPAAPELCDGLDNDCDGTVDDGAGTTWYQDLDADGYGLDAVTSFGCTAPVGYVALGGDCDDTTAAVSPAAPDSCGDGVDSDCDGSGGPDDDEDGDGVSFTDEDAAGADPCSEDTDGDGLHDGEELDRDTDGDGTPDVLDGDDDNDGIDTIVEVPYGMDPLSVDSDDDGIDDLAEFSLGDSDGDGLFDAIDVDDDNDGLLTVAEGSTDLDGDGIPNHLDWDSDGDGTYDLDEGAGDEDGDLIPNFLDANDAVADPDPDGDGLPTVDENALGTDPVGADTDGDGRDDLLEVVDPANPLDTDGDSIIDALDDDDDGDGIPTVLEGSVDTDGDAIVDALDPDDDGDGVPTAAEDTNGNGDWSDDDADGDGTPDWLDAADSGEPGEPDADADGDGITDDDERAIGSDPNASDSDGDTLLDGEEVGDPSAPTDTDDDGLPDLLDDDDDGDGLPTWQEGTDDPDGDGLGNHLDPDSDGDGAADAAEGAADRDGNGVPDYLEAGGAPPEPSTSAPDYGFGLGCATAAGSPSGGVAWLLLLLLARRRR